MARFSLAAALLTVLASCQTGAATGASCARTGDCASPLVCRFGRCRSECTQQRDCPIGSICLLDESGAGSCALPDDPGCSTTQPCAAPLACFEGTCANLCDAAVVSCPLGSMCETQPDGRARCTRIDVDAGAPDAAIDAAVDAGCHGPSCDPVVQIAVGYSSTCARTMGGALRCWGWLPDIGREADETGCTMPTPPPSSAPFATTCVHPRPVRQRVTATSDAQGVDMLAGTDGGYCYVASGRLFCFGHDQYTVALGTPSNGQTALPVERRDGITIASDFTRIYVLERTAFAFPAAADGLAWGDDTWGQRGDTGDPMSAPQDLAVPMPDPVPSARAFEVGSWHGCAAIGTGVTCWGQNDNGQSGGLPVGMDQHHTPMPVPGLSGTFTELALGRGFSCALAAPDVWCWGSDQALGNASPMGCAMGVDRMACPATQVTRDPSVRFMHLGRSSFVDSVCAIDESGRVWCWGTAGTTVVPSGTLPAPFSALAARVSDVQVGPFHACAIVAGDVWCWGENDHGQLGRDTGSAIDMTPAPVVW